MSARRRAFRRGFIVLAVPALLSSGARLAFAQSTDDAGDAPRVEELTIAGAEALAEEEIRAAIYTESTRCRGFILRPFCLLSDSHLWQEVERLDSLEVRRDELRIRVLYFRRGYRSATVSSSILPRGADVAVRFDIAEGPPTTLTSMEITGGEAVLDADDVARAFPPQVGEPLDLIRLDSAALRLRERLDEEGYIDAQVVDSAVVDAATRTGSARIDITTGPRSTLAEVAIVGNESVADRVIRTALDLRPGDVLTSARLYGSQRNLYQSNLFRLARVSVPPGQDSAKVLLVEVVEAPPRGVNGGVGVSTIDFVQVEGGFTHYDLLGGAQLLDVQATVGNLLANQLEGSSGFIGVTSAGFFERDEGPFLRPTWQASVTLSQPGFRSSYRNTVSASAFTHRRIVPGIAVDRGVGGSVALTRKLDPRSPLSLTYRYEVSRVEAGEVYYCINFGVCEPTLIGALRQGQALAPLGVSFFADRSDDPLSPTSGFHARLEAEHASAATLSDFRYNRATAEYAHYFPVGERRVIAGHIRAGWVRGLGSSGPALGLPEDLDLVHPRKRFYAGGSRSVRGFGESQLGPRILSIGAADLADEELGGCSDASIADGSCDPAGIPSDEFIPRPLGGERVLEANIEYRFPLFGEVGGAVFVDAGWVGGGTLDAKARAAATPGVGFRYQSPVGPIRIDLGVRPAGTEELRVVTEFVAADGERRIVQLDTPRQYDPLEGRSGIGRLLSRLTLHFSIGQAF